MSDRNTDIDVRSNPNPEDPFASIQSELLEAILAEDSQYLWNPADPATETYFNALDRAFDLGDWSETEEILPRSRDFFAQLDRCWADTTAASTSESSLDVSLQSEFGDRVPASWLEAIANRVRELADASLSPIDRLVECVQPILSDWSSEDLQVFARPLAYAMRGSREESEVKPWEELSEVEKARYTLKIAQYALEQNQSDTL